MISLKRVGLTCSSLVLLASLCGCATTSTTSTSKTPDASESSASFQRLTSPKDEAGRQFANHASSREPAPDNSPPTRPFDFEKDTFAYANGLLWEYSYDAQGHWQTHKREPKPTYYQHCFVVARSARQFFDHARFDPSLPRTDEATYRALVKRVVGESPRHVLPEARKFVIPGYPDLRSFSQEHEALLKAECGSATQCYIQIGNWRTIFPFTRGEQEHMARQLVNHLCHNRPVLIHVLRFPQLSINHAVLAYKAEETPAQIDFTIYDPNNTAQPVTLTFDRTSRTFQLPPSNYFCGGPVNVYEIYWKWNY